MNNQTTYTRLQYLNNECTHEQYYSQFVNDTNLSSVKRYFKDGELKNAFILNEHFNTIPLSKWDNIAGNLYDVSKKMKECGDYLTLSGGVCIAKCAARLIVKS